MTRRYRGRRQNRTEVSPGGKNELPRTVDGRQVPPDGKAPTASSAGYCAGSRVSVATVAALTAAGVNGNGRVEPARHGSIWSV